MSMSAFIKDSPRMTTKIKPAKVTTTKELKMTKENSTAAEEAKWTTKEAKDNHQGLRYPT